MATTSPGQPPMGSQGPGAAGVASLLGGWAVLLAGVALIPLPGPGSLVAVAGLRLLAPHHRWAARLYEPCRQRAVDAARASVSTRPRLAVACAGPVGLVAAATAYTIEAVDGRVALAGTTWGAVLPFAGPVTAAGLWVSAASAAALLLVTLAGRGPLTATPDVVGPPRA